MKTEQIILYSSRARVVVMGVLFTVLLVMHMNYLDNINQAACAAASLDSSDIRLANSNGRERQVEGATRQKQDMMLSQQEVESLVHQCFDGLFRADTSTLAPGFVVGDFDGDKIPDLFVTVRRTRSIDVGDTSQPPFNLQDVLHAASAANALPTPTMGDIGRGEDRLFYVILHHLAADTKVQCPSKLQRFVLFFATDKGNTKIRVFHGTKLPPGTIGDPKEEQPPPRLKGDAILLVDDESIGQALFWDGSQYRWYPFN